MLNIAPSDLLADKLTLIPDLNDLLVLDDNQALVLYQFINQLKQ